MKLLIAGGGTGGHLFPGIAIVQELLSRSPSHEVLFVGTKKGMEVSLLPKFNLPLKCIHISGLKGKSWGEKLYTLFLIPLSIIQSFFIVKKMNPDVVLGVGGYASFSVLVASFFLRKKRAIQEQNLKPGLTNRLLSRIAQKIFVSFEESLSYFPSEKCIVTGNPVRKLKKEAYERSDQFTIFIFGGSQGAHSLNRAVLDALPYLELLKDKLHVIHQTGKSDLKWVASTYFQHQWKAEVYDFLYDMEKIFSVSDYVICRAGASSVSELALLGKACLFVPYPYAAHNHQEENARTLEKKGACRVILDWQLNGHQLAKEIRYAYDHPRELEEMSKKIISFSHPYAAQAIVDQLLSF
ncbi:MAG: undecaprenyldiphospho-muramoylpentapeptide beta-N-acetylglucosaminyltransferase [Deltaproteobacteria bacterium]|nr:undecaprenyldiphospho-muramoylpentapeptide beta-N-acetylglucosaminyltransferase [Deltaproteobacteria bacterium]